MTTEEGVIVKNGRATESHSLDQAIAHRAYQIWEDEGRPDGRDQEHWARAEDEVLLHGGAPSGKRGPDANVAPSPPRATRKQHREPDPSS